MSAREPITRHVAVCFCRSAACVACVACRRLLWPQGAALLGGSAGSGGFDGDPVPFIESHRLFVAFLGDK